MTEINKQRIEELEAEIAVFSIEQDKTVLKLETQLFDEEIKLAERFEKHAEKNTNFLERLSVISGIIAPLSLTLLNFDFVNKVILLISFTLFLINIVVIQIYIHKYLNDRQSKYFDTLFNLFDLSHLLFTHKSEKDLYKKMDIYSDILNKHSELVNHKKIPIDFGVSNRIVNIILAILGLSVGLIIFSLISNYIFC